MCLRPTIHVSLGDSLQRSATGDRMADMNSNPKRRWYQFSLRTFLVVMIIASAAFGYWVHWSREWIRQRHEALEHNIAMPPSSMPGDPGFRADLPWSLRFF